VQAADLSRDPDGAAGHMESRTRRENASRSLTLRMIPKSLQFFGIMIETRRYVQVESHRALNFLTLRMILSEKSATFRDHA